jgi:hypothetical protein
MLQRRGVPLRREKGGRCSNMLHQHQRNELSRVVAVIGPLEPQERSRTREK